VLLKSVICFRHFGFESDASERDVDLGIGILESRWLGRSCLMGAGSDGRKGFESLSVNLGNSVEILEPDSGVGR
jgi:hypothetical protein